MITDPLRTQVDRLWDEFRIGGISNPLSAIEQITYLIFLRRLDDRETLGERAVQHTNPDKPFHDKFGPDEQNLRLHNFKDLSGDEMFPLVRDKVFAHLRKTGGEYVKDANLMIVKPSLLVSVVRMVDQLPLMSGDTKGDLYEYLLSKLTTAGMHGQFRTPRHVIRLMVDLVLAEVKNREELSWRVCDPACGTGGFLVSVMEHLMQKYTSEKGKPVEGVNGKQQETYTGDGLNPQERKHLTSDMLSGFDFDVAMLRIADMNLALHGADPDKPTIHHQDTMSNSFPEKFPKLAADAFDVVLANPPFKGSLDASDVHSSLTRVVKTRKTELLFVALTLRLLKPGGRCAMIVPDGVLFGSSNAHVAVRKALVEENQLEAVVKLPAGVFKPYAGVSTAILMFRKGGRTDHVWFYDVQTDGFSLDDRREPVPENDLPDVLEKWKKRNPKTDVDRKAKAFFVPKADIVAQDYDLSLNRYKEVVHEEVTYDPPKVILAKLKTLEAEIAADLTKVEGDAVTVNIPDARLGDHASIISSGSTLRGGEIVQKGDVLLNINGASIGHVATFQLEGVRANVNQHVCIIRPNPGELDSEYLAYFLSSTAFQEEINNILRGRTQQVLTFGQIAEFRVPLPPFSEQRRIANVLGQADAIRRKHLGAAKTAGELVGSLVQQAFRGEL